MGGASRSLSPTNGPAPVQPEDELPDDLAGQEVETDGQASSDDNSDRPGKAAADGRDVRPVTGDALFAFRKMQSERKAAVEARENKVEHLPKQRRREPSPPPEDF